MNEEVVEGMFKVGDLVRVAKKRGRPSYRRILRIGEPTLCDDGVTRTPVVIESKVGPEGYFADELVAYDINKDLETNTPT